MVNIKEESYNYKIEIKFSNSSGELEIYDCLEVGKEILLHKGNGFVIHTLANFSNDLLNNGAIEWYVNFYGTSAIIKIYDYDEFCKFKDELARCVTHTPFKSWDDIAKELKKHYDSLV